MKTELRTLYKKNPKLALQVAKALGYKIKAEQGMSLDSKAVAVTKQLIKALKVFQAQVVPILQDNGSTAAQQIVHDSYDFLDQLEWLL